jgi:hypothetical protein
MAGVPLASRAAKAAGGAASRPVAWYAAPAAAILSVAAGYVHLAYTESHWEDWWAYGLFFLATGVGQLLFGPLILRWPRPGVIALGIAGNLAIVGMYVYSRTEGIPFGPHARVVEKAGAVDLATTAVEIVLVVLLLLMVGPRVRRWLLNALLVAGGVLWLSRLTEALQ